MGLRTRLKKDLENVFNQLADYEKHLRQAKATGKKQVDVVTKQIHRTRQDIEKKVHALVEKEVRTLNTRVNRFLNSLLSAAQTEKKSSKPRKRKTTRAKTSATKA